MNIYFVVGLSVPPQLFEKGAVLQEVRIFSANPLKPRACYSLLSRILWVMMHGEAINKKEATNVFFAVTKLFQSKDVRLLCKNCIFLHFYASLDAFDKRILLGKMERIF